VNLNVVSGGDVFATWLVAGSKIYYTRRFPVLASLLVALCSVSVFDSLIYAIG
jgi:hypothetical protein